jgi:hypothetical protein
MFMYRTSTRQDKSISYLLNVAQSGRLLVSESVLQRLGPTWRHPHLEERMFHLARWLVSYFIIVNVFFRARISVVERDGLNSWHAQLLLNKRDIQNHACITGVSAVVQITVHIDINALCVSTHYHNWFFRGKIHFHQNTFLNAKYLWHKIQALQMR